MQDTNCFPTLLEALEAVGATQLLALLDALGLYKGLAEQDNAVTVFAPSNDAITKALRLAGVTDMADITPEQKKVLTSVVTYHLG